PAVHSIPATSTIDAPTTTQPRDWPKSCGTPITRIFLGIIFDGVATATAPGCFEATSFIKLLHSIENLTSTETRNKLTFKLRISTTYAAELETETRNLEPPQGYMRFSILAN